MRPLVAGHLAWIRISLRAGQRNQAGTCRRRKRRAVLPHGLKDRILKRVVLYKFFFSVIRTITEQ